jgi:hypothetical protein
MSRQLYVTLEWNFPRGRKQVIGPLTSLKGIRVTELAMEEGQAPALTETVVWSPPETKPLAATKKTARKVTAAKRGKRTMSAATRAKISQAQRKRHAAKANGSTVAA